MYPRDCHLMVPNLSARRRSNQEVRVDETVEEDEFNEHITINIPRRDVVLRVDNTIKTSSSTDSSNNWH